MVKLSKIKYPDNHKGKPNQTIKNITVYDNYYRMIISSNIFYHQVEMGEANSDTSYFPCSVLISNVNLKFSL